MFTPHHCSPVVTRFTAMKTSPTPSVVTTAMNCSSNHLQSTTSHSMLSVVTNAVTTNNQLPSFSSTSSAVTNSCRLVPTPSSLISVIEQAARYEFCLKPAAPLATLHFGIPSCHKAFWDGNLLMLLFLFIVDSWLPLQSSSNARSL